MASANDWRNDILKCWGAMNAWCGKKLCRRVNCNSTHCTVYAIWQNLRRVCKSIFSFFKILVSSAALFHLESLCIACCCFSMRWRPCIPSRTSWRSRPTSTGGSRRWAETWGLCSNTRAWSRKVLWGSPEGTASGTRALPDAGLLHSSCLQGDCISCQIRHQAYKSGCIFEPLFGGF